MRTGCVFGVLLVLLVAQSGYAETINTSGEAVAYVTPDEVTLSAGIETFHAELAMAKNQNNDAAAKILVAVKALGVDEKQIQADMIHVDLVYEQNNNWLGGPIKGYIIRRCYQITLKEIGKFEALVDAVLSNGANRLMGFQFKTNSLRKHRDEARAMAVKAAKEKAQDMVSVLDGTITRPTQIDEAHYGYNEPFSWVNNWNGGGYGRRQSYAQNAVQVHEGASVDGGTMPLGKIGISAKVNIRFEYSLKK